MSAVFTDLYSAMKKDRIVFIDDAFFTFNDKSDPVTSTYFFSMNDAATVNLLTRLEEIADGRGVKISLHKDEKFAPEARVLAARGYTATTSSKNMQHWEKRHAPHAA